MGRKGDYRSHCPIMYLLFLAMALSGVMARERGSANRGGLTSKHSSHCLPGHSKYFARLPEHLQTYGKVYLLFSLLNNICLLYTSDAADD